jgi:PBSX family phage portal protein
MNGQPYAFTTKGGQVVLKEVLDQYAIKDARKEKVSLKDPFKEIVVKEDEYNDSESKQAPEVPSTQYGYYGLIDPPINPLLLTNFTRINTYHARCCRTKAGDIGGLGWHLTLTIKDNENKKAEESLNKFFQLSRIPDTVTNAEQDKQEVGWGTVELIREGGLQTGLPRRLIHVHSHTIRIHRNKRKFMQTWDGVARRWFKRYGARNYEIDPKKGLFDVNVETGEEVPFNTLPKEKVANELIYNMRYSSRTSYYGEPDWTPAIRTMLGDQAAVDYNLVFFKNFGIPAYAVYITGNFNDKPILDEKTGKPTGKTEMQLAMEEKFQQVLNNPHGSMIFMIPQRGPDANIQIQFEKLSVETKESHFRLYRLESRDEVVTAHGVDPYRIGINQTGSLGGNTASEGKKSYKSSVAIPGQRSWEDEFNQVIWNESPEGFGFTSHSFKLEEIDIEDESALETSCITLLNNGIMTPNDVIRNIGKRYGLEIITNNPAMELHYFNGRPIDGAAPAAATEAAIKVMENLKKDMEEVKKNYETSN